MLGCLTAAPYSEEAPLPADLLTARLRAARPTVKAAYELSAALPADQMRDEGYPYSVHPLCVANHIAAR